MRCERWEMILAIAGLSLLATGVSLVRRSALPRRDVVAVTRDCQTPATVLDPPGGVNRIGTAILLHGLGANRRTMMFLGYELAAHGFRGYLLDLPGHGDNENAFSFAKAERCAEATSELLERSGQADPDRTILLGHSMGGAIAIRLADRDPVAATIAISPAPLVRPRRMPANLFVLNGQFDLWPMKRQTHDLAAAAGGQRTRLSDFAQKRAAQFKVVPYATHTSLILDDNVAHAATLWALEAVVRASDAKTLEQLASSVYSTRSAGRRRLAGVFIGLLGLALLFPAAATLSASLAGPPQREAVHERPPYRLLVVEESVCALVSVLWLALDVPLRFLRLYNGDYLASLLLLSAGLVLIPNRKIAKQSFSVNVKALVAASALGVAVVLAAGAWFNWQLTDLWMNGPRWLRFAALLPVAWFFCFAEEVVLGPVGSGKRRALRLAVSLVMRAELWLACVFAYYTLLNGEVLIGVLVIGLAMFSALQRAATDALRRRTGSAIAAAGFGAILAAWFIAAVFPLA